MAANPNLRAEPAGELNLSIKGIRYVNSYNSQAVAWGVELDPSLFGGQPCTITMTPILRDFQTESSLHFGAILTDGSYSPAFQTFNTDWQFPGSTYLQSLVIDNSNVNNYVKQIVVVNSSYCSTLYEVLATVQEAECDIQLSITPN